MKTTGGPVQGRHKVLILQEAAAIERAIMVALRSMNKRRVQDRRVSSIPEQPKKPFGQEKALLDHILQIGDDCEGYVALHLHLSRLSADLRQPENMRDAISSFQEFVVTHDARLFCLADLDIILTARDAPLDELERVVTRLRYRFRSDPISRPVIGAGDRFCSWYELQTDYDTLYAFAQRRSDVGDARKREAATRVRLAKSDVRHPLTPLQLEKIQNTIGKSDITAFVRSQPVCGVRESKPPQPVFDEHYVSIDALQSQVVPDVRLLDSPWLFKHLTGCLDRHMLTSVSKGAAPERAISINLSVETVLSTDFAKFERLLAPPLAGKLVVELQAADFFLDTDAFSTARDLLRQQGHTLCLDGLTYQTVALVDRKRLGVDLIKLRWSDDMAAASHHQSRGQKPTDALKRAVDQIGPARLILCRCDGSEAVTLGRDMGISLFQGRHIDYLLAVQNTVAEKARRLGDSMAEAVANAPAPLADFEPQAPRRISFSR